jgi:hypothetical protein
MPRKLSWDERCAEDAEGPVRLWSGALIDPEWRNGSAAVSEAVGCTFKSCLGNHSGVAQWQGVRLWPGIREFDSLHRNQRGVAQIVERLAWDQEVEMAEFSTPTDGIPERDVKSRELDCSLSLRR